MICALSETDVLNPYAFSLVIGHVHRDPKFFRRQTQRVRQKLPCKANGVLFEIVAEAEISQHLKERVMARGIAHIFQIIVLTPRPHTALRAGSTL